MSAYKGRISDSGIIMSGPLQIFSSEKDKKKALSLAKLHPRTVKPLDASFLCDAKKANQLNKNANRIAGICDSRHKVALNGSKTATTGTSPNKVKVSKLSYPGLQMGASRGPGKITPTAVPLQEYQGNRVVNGRKEVLDLIAKGKIAPNTKIAFRDRSALMHVGRATDILKDNKLPE